jgi:hypothetical protein
MGSDGRPLLRLRDAVPHRRTPRDDIDPVEDLLTLWEALDVTDQARFCLAAGLTVDPDTLPEPDPAAPPWPGGGT